MAHSPNSVLVSLLIFNILLALSSHAREIPKEPISTDNKQPQSFIDSDGSVLIPGIGRVILPDKGPGFNPFTYNPITGTNGGLGLGGGIYGTGAGFPRQYIPGNDDNLVPNPGFEVPIPGSGGSIPAEARP
ncbi:hypothetical protein NMG60_11003024 [Bertholletia excelsa]